MVLIVSKAIKKAKRAKELKALRKAHEARLVHQKEMIKFSDEYIIEQYEKKYGFDEINKKMFIDVEENSSRLSSEQQDVSPSKKQKLVKKKLDTIIEEDSLFLSEGDNTQNQIDITKIHSP